LQFSSTKSIDKKRYHTRATSQFRVKYIYFSVLTNTALQYCNTQCEVLLSKQVNYNQVVVTCKILQECFLQNFNMQKFQNMEHSDSTTFQGLSRAWNFCQNSRTSRTSQGPYEPWLTPV